jgi:glycosyltransferase involved in cell wall biosynthesis
MIICLDVSPLLVKNLSGIGNYSTELILSLLDSDSTHVYNAFAFLPIDSYKSKSEFQLLKHPRIINKKIIPIPSKLSAEAFLLWQKFNFPSLEQLLGYTPDLYINFDWYIPPTNSAKIITTVFDLTTVLFPSLHKNNNVRLQNIKLQRLDRVDKIITISESAKTDLIKFNDTLQDKINVIYPGCKRTVSLSNINQLKEKYNFEFILTVGTIEPRKNLKNLIKAYLDSKEIVKKKLVIVGGVGWKSQEIEELIKQNSSDIIALGYVSDQELNYLYNSCHAFVYVSFYEGFGMPPLEAMSVGKNVLVSNTSSLPEVVGPYGIKVNPSSVEEISLGLIKLSQGKLSDKEKNEIINYTKKFNFSDSADKLLKLINSL